MIPLHTSTLALLLPIKQGAYPMCYARGLMNCRNTLILISVLCGLHPGKADIALTGASLLAFLVSAFIFARASLIRAPRSRKRGWILFSLAIQNVLLLIPAALLSSRAAALPGQRDWALITLLAASAGIQVVLVSILPNNLSLRPFSDAEDRLARPKILKSHLRCLHHLTSIS